MDSGRQLIEALAQVSQEKGIDKEVIFEAIETSLIKACKGQMGENANLRVTVNRTTGAYTVFATKIVSETITDPILEITLEDAQLINSQLEIGDSVDVNVTPKDFGRRAAQTAKQAVVQKFREAEREVMYNEYSGKQSEVVTGIVQRRDRKNVMVSIGKLEAALPPTEQMVRDTYEFNDRIKVYVLEVKKNTKGPMINVSRTHPELLRKLFEQEVPEVNDGTVEVKSVAREAGNRSKVAVYTTHPHVDPIGACVGQSGQRVNTISSELRGEKLDIIQWSTNPEEYIASALSPSKVTTVIANSAEMTARVVVPDNQLSLAIGKEGQNARLAARLTGWKIDIKSETQVVGTDFLNFPARLQDNQEEPENNLDLEAAYAEFYEDSGNANFVVEPMESISEESVAQPTPSDAEVDTFETETLETLEEPSEEELSEASEYEEYDDDYYEYGYDDEYGEYDEYNEGDYYDDDYYEYDDDYMYESSGNSEVDK